MHARKVLAARQPLSPRRSAKKQTLVRIDNDLLQKAQALGATGLLMSSQFTVYKNKNRDTSSAVPFLLDIQNDLLDELETRVVRPLRPLSALKGKALKVLTPVLEIEGESFLMLTPHLAGIPKSELSPVARVEARRADIIAALDFLVTGI
jgi:toxin CcdB